MRGVHAYPNRLLQVRGELASDQQWAHRMAAGTTL
jgi:hypothetical protein